MAVSTIPPLNHVLIFVDSTKFTALMDVYVKMDTMISVVSAQDAPTKQFITPSIKDVNAKEDSNMYLVGVFLSVLKTRKELSKYVCANLVLIEWMENASYAQNTQLTMKLKKNACADNHTC